MLIIKTIYLTNCISNKIMSSFRNMINLECLILYKFAILLFYIIYFIHEYFEFSGYLSRLKYHENIN